MSPNHITGRLASQAEFFVNNLAQTDYQYNEHIVAGEGIWDCDCNSFVGFVLQSLAPEHYAMIPRETSQKRPRAFEYYTFFVSPTLEDRGGWRRIDSLEDARRGDIIAWRLPQIAAGQDTGHVFYVADTPRVLDSGSFAVRVYDSASSPHFDDTRGTSDGRFPNGVGSGFIHFEVDGSGAPLAFQFGPSAPWRRFPIAIGRAESL